MDLRIGKFRKGDFMRDDHGYKELEKQALHMMLQCDQLIDVHPIVKTKRQQVVHTIEQLLKNLESKVPVYD